MKKEASRIETNESTMDSWYTKNFREVRYSTFSQSVILQHAEDRQTKQKVAIKEKMVHDPKIFKLVEKGVENALKLSKTTKNVLPVQRFEVDISKQVSKLSFSMPWGDSLHSQFEEERRFSAREVYAIIRGILEALRAAKDELGISHNNIKPTNIIEYDGKYYLSDWESSELQNGTDPNLFLSSISRDFHYIAPEIRKENKISNGFKSDVFSLGLVGLQLCGIKANKIIAMGLSEEKEFMQRKDIHLQQLAKSDRRTKTLLTIIDKMLTYDPKLRMDADELLEYLPMTLE